MKYCPKCNSEYADRFRYCRLDGTPLVEKQVAEPTPTETKKEQVVEAQSGEMAERPIGTEDVFASLSKEISPSPLTQEPSAEAKLPVIQENFQESPRDLPHDVEPRKTEQRPHSKPVGGERFELLAQEEIKKAFPSAFVRSGVQIRSLRRTTEADIFVLLPKGLFLIECKNYSGKISGSFNYDQEKGEFWTSETPSGETVEIKSSGKNPADQALTRFHALHDMAKEAWGEDNRPYIHPVLLFPDGADLSGVVGLPIDPYKPSTRDRVVATTLAKIIPYLANADAPVEPVGALKLVNEILGIPRSSLSGTWLEKPFEPEPREKPAKEPQRQPDRQPPREDLSSSPELEDQFPVDDHGYHETPPTEQRHPSLRKGVVAITAVAVGALLLFIIGRQIFKPTSRTEAPDIVSRPEPPSREPPGKSPLPPLDPPTEPLLPKPYAAKPETPVKPLPLLPRPPVPGEGATAGRTEEPPSPPPSSTPRRPAEPGTYETTKMTYARTAPSDSAEVLDELKSGVRFQVVGSQGDWLVVRSKRRQATVYIRRDDTMLVTERRPAGQTGQEADALWNKLAIEIRESILNRGIQGVEVSVIGDTAYLKGQVRTEHERFIAEQAARSRPEVQNVVNWIWLVP